MQHILGWIKNFDAIKAIMVAIVAILGSWYDLKTDVKLNQIETQRVKSELAVRVETTAKLEMIQDQQLRDIKSDITAGFQDLRNELRQQRGYNSNGRSK